MTNVVIKPKKKKETRKLMGSGLRVGDCVVINNKLYMLTMSLNSDQRCCYSLVNLKIGKPLNLGDSHPFMGSILEFFTMIDKEMERLSIKTEFVNSVEILWELEEDKE